MASFSIGFLGCKVSQTDAQGAPGAPASATGTPRPTGPRPMWPSSTPAVSRTRPSRKSRQAARRVRPGRTGASTSPVAGRGLSGGFCRAPSRTSPVVARPDRGGGRDRVARRRRRDRLCPRRTLRLERDPRLRQDPGRLLFLVLVLCDSARARGDLGAAALRPCSPRSAAASRRGTARSCSPGSTSAASATGLRATPSQRLIREAGAVERASSELRLSSIEINHVDGRPDCGTPRDAGRSGRTCTCPATSRVTTTCCATMRRRYTVNQVPAHGSSGSRTST